MSRFRYVLPILALGLATRWPDSTVGNVVRYAAMAYILIDLSLRARAGYLRRLPHWTSESWRRYFTLCAMFAAVLLISMGMAAAVDFRFPIVGAGGSAQRAIWVGALIALMVIGGGGLASAVFWLTEGDPATQFTRFQRQRS